MIMELKPNQKQENMPGDHDDFKLRFYLFVLKDFIFSSVISYVQYFFLPENTTYELKEKIFYRSAMAS